MPTPITNQIINGNFQDTLGNPLANGYLLFQLNQDSVDEASGHTQICAGRTIKVPLNSTGNVPSSPVYLLWINAALELAESFYMVSAYTAGGKLVWGPYPQVIPASPFPFDLGTWTPGDI